MKSLKLIIFLFFISISVAVQCMPYLKKQGTATQLIVEGKPLLMLGGELANSSTSDKAYMQSIFPRLKDMKLNTVLAPVYWELMEPVEGQFDFQLVDEMIRLAQQSKLKLVLLWFGSWKNSMSCYAPAWVKTNPKRFPYARKSDGQSMEILSPFSEENLKADKKAFVALMRHLKQVDEQHQTVIMVQVENEIGMIPEARDKIKEAVELYHKQVPAELLDFLKSNKKTLQPHILKKWASSGYATTGNWEALFGNDVYTEEIFQAWYFARYVNEITQAGKAEYNLPMYLNAALNTRNRKPGEYPGAGPLAHLLDLWHAGAPAIDFLAPDIYDSAFADWCKLYNIAGNSFFIPETQRGDFTAARVFYAFGAHETMGFCPFSIESTDKPLEEPLVKSYGILHQLSPILLAKQGLHQTAGVWLTNTHKRDTIVMGEYVFVFAHDYTLGWSPESKNETWPESGALIIQLAKNEFMVAGTGVVVTCSLTTPGTAKAGILSVDEGCFEQGEWIPGRRLNGDETHQGRHVRIPVGNWDMQRFQLYSYK